MDTVWKLKICKLRRQPKSWAKRAGLKIKKHSSECFLNSCRGEDSNLHPFLDWFLKPARLPITPPRQVTNFSIIAQAIYNCEFFYFSSISHCERIGMSAAIYVAFLSHEIVTAFSLAMTDENWDFENKFILNASVLIKIVCWTINI